MRNEIKNLELISSCWARLMLEKSQQELAQLQTAAEIKRTKTKGYIKNGTYNTK